ncbi:MAG: protein NO VEIN domain-containing protein [Planctomycetota bacterium]
MTTKSLVLYDNYTREEVHGIFSPETAFTRRGGTWARQGVMSIPDRPNDFVFLVSFGQKQGGHIFKEPITELGVLTWQSQPKQSLNNPRAKKWIHHDESKNSIYLFLRTRKGVKYTCFGRLKYITHDAEQEKPVHFQWQILDWPIPQKVLDGMGLTLQESVAEGQKERATLPRGVLQETQPPTVSPYKGTTTRTFRGRKAPDYSARDEQDRKLGRLGEELVVKHEKASLLEQGQTGLADKVIHVSAIEGDGAGYDIRSYKPDGEVKYIEVKTTRRPAQTPFFMSSNEVEFSKQHSQSYYLYRVFNYVDKTDSGQFYMCVGSIEENFSLSPIQYRVKGVT